MWVKHQKMQRVKYLNSTLTPIIPACSFKSYLQARPAAVTRALYQATLPYLRAHLCQPDE